MIIGGPEFVQDFDIVQMFFMILDEGMVTSLTETHK
jgi:hypothetical protein